MRAWTIVDPEVYAWAKEFKWFLNGPRRFAYRCIYNQGDGTHEKRSLHREVLGLYENPIDCSVDHVNHDTLDNRSVNLRLATSQQNAENCSAHRDARSKHRGVDFHKANGMWRARACVKGQTFNLGYFSTEEEAATVAAEFRRNNMPFSTN